MLRHLDYYFYAGGGGFLSGLFFGRYLLFDPLYVFFVLVAGLVFFVLTKGRVKLIIWLLFACLAGIWRWQSVQVASGEIVSYQGREVTLSGIVDVEVETRIDKQQVIMSVQVIDGQPVQGRLLVVLPLYPSYHYGDQLQLNGKITLPRGFDGFAYDKYLARHHIYAISYYPQVGQLSVGQGNFLYSRILSFKRRLINRVNRLLPEPAASLLGGLLWGAKRSISPEIMENFNLTGTTHIVALSGYNITILGLIVFWLTPWLGVDRKKAFWLVGLIIIFFIVITGWPASVVRAGLMGILVLFAYRFGLGASAGRLLLLSAVVMCLFNPLILFYDVGFQLSFLATIGLLYLTPCLRKFLSFLPKTFALRETVATTTAAVIITAPLVVWQFNRLSLVSLLANVLILFIIPTVMALGFVSVCLSFFYYPLGQVLAWLAYLPLTYIIRTTEFLAHLPGASLSFISLSLPVLLASYLVIFLFIINAAKLWPETK
jgi:competence protein ComEC